MPRGKIDSLFGILQSGSIATKVFGGCQSTRPEIAQSSPTFRRKPITECRPQSRSKWHRSAYTHHVLRL